MTITLKDLDDQRRALSEMGILMGILKTPEEPRRRNDDLADGARLSPDEPAVRHTECYLSWAPGAKAEDRASTLGPYARWLIATHLLMRRESQDELACLFPIPEIDRVFKMDKQNILREANRYVNPRARDKLEKVFTAIIDRLNAHFLATAREKLDMRQFLTVEVPLSSLSDRVGDEPIEWFEQWLQWRVGTPWSTASGTKLLQAPLPPGEPVDPQLLGEVLGAIAQRGQRRSHHHVINVCDTRGEQTHSALAIEIARTLEQQRRAGQGDGMFVVHVRLDASASRQSVLRDLYADFRLDASRLASLDRRPIDLSSDLEPLRRAMMLNRVALIFDGWDNVGGPFGSLYGYLCNTHFLELLRCLAQPHLDTWRLAPGDVKTDYVLLVLSTRPAYELKPWNHFIGFATGQEPTAWQWPVLFDPPADTQCTSPPSPSDDESKAAFPPGTSLKEILQLEEQIRTASAEELELAWPKLLDAVALRIIIAGVNGWRRATLQRCLSDWIRLFWPRLTQLAHSSPEALATLTKDLHNRFPQLLRYTEDEEVEGMSLRQRALELNRFPLTMESDEAAGSGRKVLSILSRARQSDLVSRWLAEEAALGHQGDSVRTDPEKRPHPTTCSWAHVNFIVAEESLRQGSSQLRHLSGEVHANPYPMRRIVQTIYHGLMSLEASPSSGFYASGLPSDPRKRYRYLYSFLYRRLVQGGEWRLARAFGRPDIEVELLTLFILPVLGPGMLAEGLYTRRCVPCGDPARELIAPVLREDPTMWCDLLEVLGRAATDLGKRAGRIIDWVLQQLPGDANSAETNAMLPRRDSGYYRAATLALKLEVDWRQSSGFSVKAEDLCEKQLLRHGVSAKRLRALRQEMQDLCVRNIELPSQIRPELDQLLDRELQAFKRIAREADVGESLSAILFRLAEIHATRADDGSARTAARDGANASSPEVRSEVVTTDGKSEASGREIVDFAYPFALFWIADRLRSYSATKTSANLHWPLASPRAMRYFIRTCLKLARLLTLWDTQGRHHDTANWLLDLAYSRIGSYTRHYHQYPREQVSMLILTASRLRACVRVTLDRNHPILIQQRNTYEESFTRTHDPDAATKIRRLWVKQYNQHQQLLDEQRGLLDGCWDTLQEAEDNLLSLGYAPTQVRRVYLERIKLLKALQILAQEYDELRLPGPHPLARYLPAYAALKNTLLAELDEASEDSPFWKTIVRRQLRATENSLNSP